MGLSAGCSSETGSPVKTRSAEKSKNGTETRAAASRGARAWPVPSGTAAVAARARHPCAQHRSLFRTLPGRAHGERRPAIPHYADRPSGSAAFGAGPAAGGHCGTSVSVAVLLTAVRGAAETCGLGGGAASAPPRQPCRSPGPAAPRPYPPGPASRPTLGLGGQRGGFPLQRSGALIPQCHLPAPLRARGSPCPSGLGKGCDSQFAPCVTTGPCGRLLC